MTALSAFSLAIYCLHWGHRGKASAPSKALTGRSWAQLPGRLSSYREPFPATRHSKPRQGDEAAGGYPAQHPLSSSRTEGPGSRGSSFPAVRAAGAQRPRRCRRCRQGQLPAHPPPCELAPRSARPEPGPELTASSQFCRLYVLEPSDVDMAAEASAPLRARGRRSPPLRLGPELTTLPPATRAGTATRRRDVTARRVRSGPHRP